MKKYRCESGQLTVTLGQIKKETAAEAASYYRPGSIYQNAADGREYVYLLPTPGDGELAHFQSFDGYNLFIPVTIRVAPDSLMMASQKRKVKR